MIVSDVLEALSGHLGRIHGARADVNPGGPGMFCFSGVNDRDIITSIYALDHY